MQTTSRLLINEPPLQLLPSLAVAVGTNEAIFLQQLQYWLFTSRHEHDGRKWIFNAIPDWIQQLPFLSEPTLRRVINGLVARGVVLRRNDLNREAFDKTYWYSIDYEALDRLLEKSSDQNDHTSFEVEPVGVINMTDRSDQNDHTMRSERSDDVINMINGSDQNDHTNTNRLLQKTNSNRLQQEKERGGKAPAGIPPHDGSTALTFKSPYVNNEKFNPETFYIPRGQGETAVEVYYERFNVRHNSARLTHPQEDDLMVTVKGEIEKFRDVVTAYDNSGYRAGNVRLMLDWFIKGIPNKYAGNYQPPTANGGDYPTRASGRGVSASMAAFNNFNEKFGDMEIDNGES